ncbi:MAG: hypothetical protein M3527_06295 [Actinomycetota bacterium]|nr:hypothetical protein [Acidimicrobiia bacterium]MDQ3294042.1 hypothetical protein [Actinomycetota bacterium]
MICNHCGTVVDAELDEAGGPIAPPGWSWAPSARGVQYMCQACTRANVRSIEAKLSEEWW